jgi:hypothetical protein
MNDPVGTKQALRLSACQVSKALYFPRDVGAVKDDQYNDSIELHPATELTFKVFQLEEIRLEHPNYPGYESYESRG